MLPSFNLKKFSVMIVSMIVVVAVLLCFNNYYYNQTTLNLDIYSKVFEFPYKETTNNSLFLYLSRMFMVLFKINNTFIIQYLWMFSFTIWCACLIVGLYHEKIMYSLVYFGKVILSVGIATLLIIIFSLSLNPNLTYGLG